MIKSVFLAFCTLVAFILFGLMQEACAQSMLSDTIEIEGVTIFQNRNILGNRPGTKNISIDSLVFREKKGLSLSELLVENSPIFIKTYGRGATATASFRGTGASHTLVFWNGLKINSPMSGEVDFSQIPLYFVDEVSIYFGQSSMSFGSGGLGGSVNLASSPEWGSKYSAKIYQSVGSFGSYSTGINVNYGKGKVKLQTRVFRESSQNNFMYRNKATQGYPFEEQKNADFLNYGILQEAYFRPNDSDVFSAKLWMQENDRGIPRLMSNYSVEEINRQHDKVINSIINWDHYGNASKMGFSTGVSAFGLDYIYTKHASDDNILQIINTEGQSISWNSRISYEKSLSNWFSTNIETTHSYHKVISRDLILLGGYIGNQQQMALRAKLNATPTDRLSVSLLLNEEMQGNLFSPVMPSVSAEYKLLKNNRMAIKGAVARNFHYPSLNDLYWQPGGNRNLLPESGLTYEGGMKITSSPKGLKVDFDLTLFASEIDNWIMWLPHIKGYWEPINLTLVKARGIESSIVMIHKIEALTLRLQGNYNYTRSSIENAGGIIRPESHGKQLPFIPVHSGGVVVNAAWNGFNFVYTFTHFSERFTTTSNNPNSFRRLYSYYMSSAALGKDFKVFGTCTSAQFRVDNLLNESYQSILWRPMPGINYSLMLKIEL